MYAHRPAIDEAPQPSLNIHARAACAPFAFTDDTVVGAQEASDRVVFVQGSPVTRPGRRLHQLIYDIACQGDVEICS